MLWFFERQRARLHFEVRRHTHGDDYELVITRPDGDQDVELFSDVRELLDRMQGLQLALHAEGWMPPPRRALNGRAIASPPLS